MSSIIPDASFASHLHAPHAPITSTTAMLRLAIDVSGGTVAGALAFLEGRERASFFTAAAIRVIRTKLARRKAGLDAAIAMEGSGFVQVTPAPKRPDVDAIFLPEGQR